MRLEYLAPFRDSSGYGEASRGIMRDMLYTRHTYDTELRYKPVSFGSIITDKIITEVTEPLGRTTFTGEADVSLQHVNPDFFVPDLAEINIGYCTHETNMLCDEWVDKCNLMNHIFVPCKWNQMAFKMSGVDVPVSVMPHKFDFSFLNKKIDQAEPGKILDHTLKQVEDNFLFYSILQLSPKKGIDVLIRAFVREFSFDDRVTLVLKYHITKDSERDREIALTIVRDLLKKEKVSNLPRIVMIGDIIEEQDIFCLHRFCDCYVSTSMGEGWNIPAFIAAVTGNKLIMPLRQGMKDWGSRLSQETIIEMYDSGTVDASDIMPCRTYPPGSMLSLCSIHDTAEKMRYAYKDGPGGSLFRHEGAQDALKMYDITSSPHMLEEINNVVSK